MFNQSGSRRWTHFHSALQLAIQRSAHRWSYEDFAECFHRYAEEEKNGSSATYNSISDYIEAQNFRDLDKLFKDYNVQESIDLLHKVVNEAKERKARGEIGKDVWKEDLAPQAAVSAKTVPVLETEVKRVRESLEKVKAENRRLQAQLSENEAATETAHERTLLILDSIDEAHDKWQQVPLEEIEERAVQTEESLRPTTLS